MAITRERVRRGERFDFHAVARGAMLGIRGALIGLGLSEKQREAFLLFAAAEILRDNLQHIERTSLKRRVN